MSFPQRFSGTLTTNGSGAGTLTLPSDNGVNANGVLLSIRHEADATSPYADNFAYTVTTSETGRTLLAETTSGSAVDFDRIPSLPTQTAADGTVAATAEDLAAIANERLIITVASGGDTKVGTWTITIG